MADEDDHELVDYEEEDDNVTNEKVTSPDDGKEVKK